MLALNEYESKSRTSLAFSVSGESEERHRGPSDSTSVYFPSPYALSRIVYESSEDALLPQASCARIHTPSHHHQTPGHTRPQQTHYDVPFKQVCLFVAAGVFFICRFL